VAAVHRSHAIGNLNRTTPSCPVFKGKLKVGAQSGWIARCLNPVNYLPGTEHRCCIIRAILVRGWILSKTRVLALLLLPLLARVAAAQSTSPYVYQVLPYATVQQSGALAGTVPSVYSYGAQACSLDSNGTPCTGTQLGNASNFNGTHALFGLSSALNSSVATALSVIPLASPASGVVTTIDPVTGAEIPSSTLGPIFTERAETIGKHRFFIGVSNQDFHFTSLNGQPLRQLRMLDPGGVATQIQFGGKVVSTAPSTYDVGMDVRLSQNVAFLTYGVTSRFDVSVGLPVVHAAVSAAIPGAGIFAGDGFNNNNSGNCWCADTFTPGSPPGSPAAPNGQGLILGQGNFNNTSLGKTGFGDMLLRFKGTVLNTRKVALAVGTDLRLPTGDERNFLGTGATAVKPFAALSFRSKPFSHGIVFSPHVNVGWQFTGKSILGGQISAATVTLPSGPTNLAPPFTSTKDYLPDVFSWAVGTEVGLGRHNTVVVDILGNQIGWIHGIQNMRTESVAGFPLPQSTGGPAQDVTASGLVSAGRVSFGEYSGAFGYKARIVGNLVATFNMLVRFDSNGLTAHLTPLYGLGYTF
jgi:hypothetical protein